MDMFCFQCQETAKNSGCTMRGVCGKTNEVAKLQDLLMYTTKGIAEIVQVGNLSAQNIPEVNREVINSLFITITNANFDPDMIYAQIEKMLTLRDNLCCNINEIPNSDAAIFKINSKEEALKKAMSVGVLSTKDPDIRSLKEMVTYGLKGMAAYLEHAKNLGEEDNTIYQFIYKALAIVSKEVAEQNELIALVLETGEYGVKAMSLLDKANNQKYGAPQITKVSTGVKNNPAILISGHDLKYLEQLLEQTKGTGVDVYSHSEMLPGHYYPAFQKYSHFVGNYGNAWWKQLEEFETFHGPILFTTNCIVPPKSQEVQNRIFTTGSAGYPGCQHIPTNENGEKDFSQIIEMAKNSQPPEEIENGEIIGGFAHEQVFALADEIVEAVTSGAIKKFVVMAGCDGRMKSREYYTSFAEELPKDTVILTAGCAKYRYNKLPLGDINGIPRVLDAGQCNDSYSLALIALKLKEIFELDDINELPIVYNIAWYEQKAVIVLLALLSLGVKNIHLGPTLPGFLSPNVANILVDTFGISSISNPQNDIKAFIE